MTSFQTDTAACRINRHTISQKKDTRIKLCQCQNDKELILLKPLPYHSTLLQRKMQTDLSERTLSKIRMNNEYKT